MKKIIHYSLSFILLVLCAPFSYAQMKGTAKHVILIVVDGFRPAFYLDQKWPARTIQSLAAEGVHAVAMRPVMPAVTKPDHITMITGAYPAKHGIYYNDPLPATKEGYNNFSQIKVPTLWEAVQKGGGTVASVNWPLSAGAPVNWNYRSFSSSGITPQEFKEEIEANITGKIPERAPSGSDFDRFNTDLRIAAVGSYLIQKHKPNFMSIHFISTDEAQHEQGLDGEKVTKAIAVADVCISQLIEATKKAGTFENTTFIIAGDHGFENNHTQIAWNTLLIKDGLLEKKPDGGNWKALFNKQCLILKDPNDKATLARVRKLLDEQPASVKKLFRIIERDELDLYGADPNAAFAIQTVEGVVSTSSISSPDLVQRTFGGLHGLLPEPSRPNLFAGFIAFGKGISQKVTIPKLQTEDIAPIIANLLGIDFKAPDGVLLPGILLADKKTSED